MRTENIKIDSRQKGQKERKKRKYEQIKSGNVVQIKCQYPLFRQNDLSLSYREELR